MVEIQQRGIEFLRSVQKVGTSYRALGLAEKSSTYTLHVCHGDKSQNDRNLSASGKSDGEMKDDAISIEMHNLAKSTSRSDPRLDAAIADASKLRGNNVSNS